MALRNERIAYLFKLTIRATFRGVHRRVNVDQDIGLYLQRRFLRRHGYLQRGLYRSIRDSVNTFITKARTRATSRAMRLALRLFKDRVHYTRRFRVINYGTRRTIVVITRVGGVNRLGGLIHNIKCMGRKGT